MYDNQMRKVGTELREAGLAEGEAFLQLAEVEVLLDFAEWFLSAAPVIWTASSNRHKRAIQSAIFPHGLPVTKAGFGTPEPSRLFNDL